MNLRAIIAIAFSLLGFLLSMIMGCKRLDLNNSCDPNSRSHKDTLATKAVLNDKSPHCGVDYFATGTGTGTGTGTPAPVFCDQSRSDLIQSSQSATFRSYLQTERNKGSSGASTADTTTITGLAAGVAKWIGGVLAPNGKIYGIPFVSTTVLITDPKSNGSYCVPVLTSAYFNKL